MPMEHIVSQWQDKTDFFLELITSDDESGQRPTRDYIREIVQDSDPAWEIESSSFRVVEVRTGREIEFPLRLVIDSKFRKLDQQPQKR